MMMRDEFPFSISLIKSSNKQTNTQTNTQTNERERERSCARNKPTWTDDIFNTIELTINAALLS